MSCLGGCGTFLHGFHGQIYRDLILTIETNLGVSVT